MMRAESLPRHAPPPRLPQWMRVRHDIVFSFLMGTVVALLMLALPMKAALASSVVGAFIILALLDTRAAVLALLLVRATIDVTATIPIISASRSSDVNAAAMMSLLVIAVGCAHLAINRVDVLRMPLAKAFAFVLAISFVGLAVAVDREAAFQDWLRLAGVFVLYVLVVDLIRTRDDVRRIITVMVLSAVVPLAIGMYQAVTGNGNHDTAGLNRIYGTFVHPSPYASYLVQLLPLAVVFFVHTRMRIARVVLGAMIPLMVLSVYATQTRAAWIGLAVVVIVFAGMRARWTLFFLPLVAAALFFALPGVESRFGEVGNNYSSVLWREQQWERSFSVASSLQLVTTGAGLGSINAALGNLAHNEYLRLLVETGIIGLTAMIVLYAQLVRVALRGYRHAGNAFERDLMLAFLMTFAARAVIALTDNLVAFPVLEWYFWSFAAVIIVMSGAYPRARIHDPEPTRSEVQRQRAG